MSQPKVEHLTGPVGEEYPFHERQGSKAHPISAPMDHGHGLSGAGKAQAISRKSAPKLGRRK
jgi:hypothetical protein